VLVASLERYSEHPLGRAVLKHAEQEGLSLNVARDVKIHKGRGLIGLVVRTRFIPAAELLQRRFEYIEADLCMQFRLGFAYTGLLVDWFANRSRTAVRL
jgi:cation transport ATPase